jgi:hypothetical protein
MGTAGIRRPHREESRKDLRRDFVLPTSRTRLGGCAVRNMLGGPRAQRRLLILGFAILRSA